MKRRRSAKACIYRVCRHADICSLVYWQVDMLRRSRTHVRRTWRAPHVVGRSGTQNKICSNTASWIRWPHVKSPKIMSTNMYRPDRYWFRPDFLLEPDPVRKVVRNQSLKALVVQLIPKIRSNSRHTKISQRGESWDQYTWPQCPTKITAKEALCSWIVSNWRYVTLPRKFRSFAFVTVCIFRLRFDRVEPWTPGNSQTSSFGQDGAVMSSTWALAAEALKFRTKAFRHKEAPSYNQCGDRSNVSG